MSEEEIIKNVKQTIEEYEEVIQEEQEKGNVEDVESGIEIKQGIQGLLDLYNKQKQELEKYKKQIDLEFVEENFIEKQVIRNKIKELEEELIQTYGTLGESLTTTEIKTLKELLGE